MLKNAHRPCPICGMMRVGILHTQHFELPVGHPLSSGYDVVKCEACSFVYADTTVGQADYDRFYTQYSKYEDGKTATGGGENPFDLARLEISADQIVNFLQEPGARILDVGCANGGLLRALAKRGYKNICGLDPSPACVENSRTLGLEAYQGSINRPFEHGKYDLVVLSHTLEHIQDVKGAIAWFDTVLDPAGLLLAFIETPDATRYVDFLYAPFQDFNTEHINHFSQIMLKNVMETAGFDTLLTGEKTLTLNPTMFYPAVFGFWKKAKVQKAIHLRIDQKLISQLDAYIQQSSLILQEMEEVIKNALLDSPRLIIWGTGQLAMKLLAETSLGKAEIVAFVDNNPINQGKTLHGVKIISPEAIRERLEPILITSTLHQQAISEQIHEMGLLNRVFLLKDNPA